MTAALTITRWHGQVHVAVAYGPPKTEQRIGHEDFRISLNSAEIGLPLAKLSILYAGYIAQSELRAAA